MCLFFVLYCCCLRYLYLKWKLFLMVGWFGSCLWSFGWSYLYFNFFIFLFFFIVYYIVFCFLNIDRLFWGVFVFVFVIFLVCFWLIEVNLGIIFNVSKVMLCWFVCLVSLFIFWLVYYNSFFFFDMKW